MTTSHPLEAAWRRRFRMRWPSVPAPPFDPPRQWTWQFEDDRGSEVGRWTVRRAGSTERQRAAPELPPAWSTGIAVGADFALAGSFMADGYMLHELRPGKPARLVYRTPTQFAVAGLSRDEAWVCIEHADHADWYHPALRVLTIDGAPVADLWDGPGLGLWAGTWSPQPDDRRLIVHHQRVDLLRPALWSPATGAVADVQLTFRGDVRASWYPQADALLLNHEHRGRHELYRYALSDGTLSRIDTPTGMIHVAGVQADGQVWYLWDSGAAPPELRNETGVIGRPEGEAIPGQSYVDVDIDGTQAFLVEPTTPRPHPAIVMLRCNMFDHVHDSYSPVVQSWVDHGFAVVLPNYRGTMGRGRAWRDAVLGNPGLTEMDDLAKVHDWIVATGIAEPGRIVLNGESWGGYLTLLALGTQPDRWAAGIAEVPMASFVDGYEDVSNCWG